MFYVLPLTFFVKEKLKENIAIALKYFIKF
jgi:hypothetical protein